MTTPADLAALRLELSQGELVCPRKGQMGKGRCVHLQQEMACTCAVAAAAGCAIADGWKPPEPEPPTQSELARREAIRAGPLRRRAATTAPTTTARPAPPAKETTMPARTGGTETLKNALLAAPGPVPFDDLVAIYPGQQRKACAVRLFQMAQKGLVEGSNRDGWRWKGGGATKPKEKKPAPKARKTPPAKAPKQERPAPEERPAPAIIQGAGHSRTIQLNSACTLTLSISADIFQLSAADREFVFSLVDSLAEYEG